MKNAIKVIIKILYNIINYKKYLYLKRYFFVLLLTSLKIVGGIVPLCHLEC